MPTQYSDFKKHLRSKDPAAADMLEEYLSCRDLWTDFERALGTIDARRILTTESEEYLPSRPGEIPDERDFSQVADAMSFKTQNLHERILKELKNKKRHGGLLTRPTTPPEVSLKRLIKM